MRNKFFFQISIISMLLTALLAPCSTRSQNVASRHSPDKSLTEAAAAEIDIKRQANKLKADEVTLKKAELEFKKQEAALSREAEYWKNVATFASVIAAALAVAAPFFVGVRSVAAQRRIAAEQAKLQFQMKAVDLVLQNSANSKQAKERARALVVLFKSEWLPKGFADDFDHADFRIDAGSSAGRRLELIKLLAEYPNSRQQVLKDWYVVNRGDWWFIDPLLESMSNAERLALEKTASRAEMNDN